MAKPPLSGPHSDIDGIHQDELTGTKAIIEAADDPADLGLTRGYGKGYSSDVVDEEANTPSG